MAQPGVLAPRAAVNPTATAPLNLHEAGTGHGEENQRQYHEHEHEDRCASPDQADPHGTPWPIQPENSTHGCREEGRECYKPTPDVVADGVRRKERGQEKVQRDRNDGRPANPPPLAFPRKDSGVL
jgi:hypothetical protein